MLGFVGGLCKIIIDIRKTGIKGGNNVKDLGAEITNYLIDGKVNNLLAIEQKYSNSGYFHQDAKLELFSDLQSILKIKKQYKWLYQKRVIFYFTIKCDNFIYKTKSYLLLL